MKLEEAMQSGEKFHWVKPWNGAPYPCNYAHPGKAFSSPINLLFLEAGEYLTYQQIRAIPDARIKKGAKQELIFQSFPIFRKDEKQELVAEITAAILCTSLGLDDKEVVQNNLAYLQYWQEHIKAARPKELYFAVVAAKEASELILESCPVAKKWLEPNFTAVNLSEQEAEQKKTEWEEKRTDGRRRNQTL